MAAASPAARPMPDPGLELADLYAKLGHRLCGVSRSRVWEARGDSAEKCERSERGSGKGVSGKRDNDRPSPIHHAQARHLRVLPLHEVARRADGRRATHLIGCSEQRLVDVAVIRANRCEGDHLPALRHARGEQAGVAAGGRALALLHGLHRRISLSARVTEPGRHVTTPAQLLSVSGRGDGGVHARGAKASSGVDPPSEIDLVPALQQRLLRLDG